MALTRWTLVGKVMSLVGHNFPSKEQGSFNFIAAVTICSDFGAPKIKSVTVSPVSPSICHEVMGLDAMILVFWVFSFKPTFSLSSFIFIKRLFSSLLSAISLVSSAYLRLLTFLLAVLIPACASSSPAFLMTYSAYKLNKQDDNIEPFILTAWELKISLTSCFLLFKKNISDSKLYSNYISNYLSLFKNYLPVESHLFVRFLKSTF